MDHVVRLECLATNPETHSGWKTKVNQADVLVLLIRHMDSASIHSIRIRYARLGGDRRVPLGIFILREEQEQEFKIGCNACGQKLWMNENDIGKKGRCPNCRTPFLIPTPSEYLRERLILPDAVPVLNVSLGNVMLCRGALTNLLARTTLEIDPLQGRAKNDLLKQSTVAIHVEDSVLRVEEN